MNGAFTFIVYLLGALLVSAFVVGIVSRLWTLEPEKILWRGISPKFAANNLQQFFIDIDDGRWAYPTGMFVPADESDPDAGKIVLREDDFKGSRGLGWALRIFQWGGLGAAGALAAGVRGGLIGVFVGVFMAMMILMATIALAIPFVFYSIMDMLLRPLMRSRIEAEIVAHPEIEDASQISLTFRGLSAFAIIDDAIEGLTLPKLPPGFAAGGLGEDAEAVSDANATAADRAAGWINDAKRRYHVIIGSGAACAVLAALLLATFAPLTTTGSSYDDFYDDSIAESSDGGYADESTDEADYADTSSENEYSGSGFSITPATDWVLMSEDDDKGGYTEWRWEPSDRSDVYMVVNKTTGFDRTPEEGGAAVRDGVSEDSTYYEYRWEADGDFWLWEFELDGDRKVDRFASSCGDGYAILYAAPADEFDAWAPELDTAASSFVGDCGADDSSSADSSEEEPDDDRVDAVSNQKFETSTPEGRAERTIRRHWQARLDGDYSAAYNLYADPVRSRAGTESNWSSEIEQDGLQSVTIGGVKPDGFSSSGGNMVVRLETDSEKEGCVKWRFVYTVNKVSGRWKITDTTATKSSC